MTLIIKLTNSWCYVEGTKCILSHRTYNPRQSSAAPIHLFYILLSYLTFYHFFVNSENAHSYFHLFYNIVENTFFKDTLQFRPVRRN